MSISGQSTVNLESEHGCDYNINLDIEGGRVTKWDISKSDQFNNRIDPIKIINLKADIDKVVNSDMSTIDKPTDNLFIDRSCDIFLSSAKETFGKVKSRQTKNIKRKLRKHVKEWFDNKCKVERQNYRKMKHKYRLNTHKRKMEKEIKIMRTNNSKDYWKLLKSKNKREEPDIPITSVYDFVL